jgi:cysteinyl-tRNA synthetase
MTLKIYNTLSRSKDVFEPIEPGKVRFYVCGPTVYAEAHIGHAMSALVFDIVRRYLMYLGYDVDFVMNFTDVDDKIIAKANELGEDPYELAEHYINEYKRNLDELNILPATKNPRATEDMPQIIDMIEKLIEKDFAYPANGDVYYRVEAKDDYGKLSGRKLANMNAGARIEVDERKDHPMDFALWKGSKPGEPAWDSPWGQGRPGWHIECSAMNMTHLGEQIDIHGGGNDLIFPHHENEIAQTEAVTGKEFSRVWMHNGMLSLKAEKMSKSLGNMISVDQFLADHPADVMRLWVLNGSYRGPLIYSEEVIEQTEQAYKRLLSAKKAALPGAKGLEAVALEALNAEAEKVKADFKEKMNDDFNTSGALAALYELVKAINQARAEGAKDEQMTSAQAVFTELTGVLGLRLEEQKSAGGDADAFIDLLVSLRRDLRAEKNWALSDKLRDGLKELGVILEDSKDGTTWSWE